MRRIHVTQNIEYLEPVGKRKLYACSGLALSGRLKIVIDTNPGRNTTRDFLKEFNPDIAIVSHYHPDHSSWCSYVQEHTKAQLMIPGAEEHYFRSLDYFVEHTVAGHAREDMMRDFVQKHLDYREVETYATYESPCSFILGDVSLECIRTPGHSPGHTSFYFPAHKMLFACDMGTDRLGPWYGWRDCSIESTIDSIFSLRSLDINLLLTSHGGIITRDIKHCWDRALLHILDREHKIRQELDMGKTREEIIRKGVCYPKKERLKEPMKSLFTLWDSVMFDLHAGILQSTSLDSLFPELRIIASTYNRPQPIP